MVGHRATDAPIAASLSAAWGEPARGAVLYPALAALTGLEQVRAMVSGRAPSPSVSRLTGRRIVEAELGTVTYLLPATAWMLGPKGDVHSGLLAFLADGPLFASVLSALPARVLCTTAELSMTFLGRPPRTAGDITARGQLIHVDDEMGLAEVFLRDADDRLVAHGTSRCAVFSPIPDSTELVLPDGSESEPEFATPDPHLRPPPEVDEPAPTGGDGLERMCRQLRGEVPRPPVDQLTGIRLTEAERGRAVFRLAASSWLRNEFGNVYGGVLTLLAKSAAAAAVQTIATGGVAFTALDVKINFLKAVPADGTDLVATGAVRHAGERLAIGEAEVIQGDVRVAVLTGTTALTPPARGA